MKLDADTLRRLSPLLEHALGLETEQREDWLGALTGADAELAPRLRELLEQEARSEADSWLERGPDLAALGATVRGKEAQFSAGDRLGPYRLLRELGVGGMGEVWLAERSDGALTRQVALKLPQHLSWRAGMAERFARERDILARLEHPHIARLYDAGLSSSEGPGQGVPYLALEYVRGTNLTQYCDERKLGSAARLALALQVLDAVQYAHTRLVIHRDLKPSNILVTDEGQVRLLDFGVAKLLAGDPGSQTEALTQEGGHALTPDYASPEQVRGEALGTASDVYTLGVVLYELLCGQRPYHLKQASLAQLERQILEATPAPPSSRVDQATAQLRGTSVARLQRELRGELDTIVLKALKKEPQQRYATVAELADDLRRQRDGEPVLARPDSFAYRARKYALRHKVVVASAAAVFLALTMGLGTALWQAHTAQLERDRAVRSAERANSLNDFATDLILDVTRVGKTVNGKDLLEQVATQAQAEFGDEPVLHSDLLFMLASLHSSLGGPMAALPYIEQAEAMLGSGGDADQLARLRCSKLPAHVLSGRMTAAAAREIVQVDARDPRISPSQRSACLYQLAKIQSSQGDPASAVQTLRDSIALLDKSSVRSLKQRARSTGQLAFNLALAGRTVEAQAEFESAWSSMQQLHMDRSHSGAALLSDWANASLRLGDARRALALADRNLELLRQTRPDLPPSSYYEVWLRAAAAGDLGRYEEALAGFRQVAAFARQAHQDRRLLGAQCSLAMTLSRVGRHAEAMREYQVAADLRSTQFASGHFGQVALHQARSAMDLDAGRFEDAAREASAVIDDAAVTKAERLQAMIIRALAEVGTGRADAALTDAAVAVALGRETQGDRPHSFRTGRALLALALAQRLLGERAASLETALEAVQQLSNSVDATHPDLVQAQRLLGALDPGQAVPPSRG